MLDLIGIVTSHCYYAYIHVLTAIACNLSSVTLQLVVFSLCMKRSLIECVFNELLLLLLQSVILCPSQMHRLSVPESNVAHNWQSLECEYIVCVATKVIVRVCGDIVLVHVLVSHLQYCAS